MSVDDDEQEGVSALLPRTAEAAIAAQRQLDAIVSPQEIDSGTHFWLHSLPLVDVRLEFGLARFQKKGFLKPTRANKLLRHRLSFRLSAIPSLIDPPPKEWGPTTLTIREPPFMVDAQTEIDLAMDVCDALAKNGCDLKMAAKDIDVEEAADELRGGIIRPSHPELGAVVFRVDDKSPLFLVVIVTDDAHKDGIFLVAPGARPAAYSIPGDGDSTLLFEPLHRLTMALADWLSGEGQPRLHPGQRLPEELGFTTLRLFAEAIIEGYRECINTLSPRPEDDVPLSPPPPAFDLSDVTAGIAFTLRQGKTAGLTLDDDPGALVQGRVALEFERLATSIHVTLTLIAPGFVLAATARDAFIGRAQKSADDIADQFPDRQVVDYVGAIMRPEDPRRVVVTLWTEEPGKPFEYLATWPVRLAGAERHFVFRSREDGDKLGHITRVMSASANMATVNVMHAESAGDVISEDTYEQYNRFFRAARVWRAGVTRASG